MVTSTPPDVSAGPANSGGGFQPAQQFGVANSAPNPLQQIQMLMAQQQQQRGTQNLNQVFANNIRQFLLYTQGLQRQQEHNNSMMNSPVPNDIGLLSAFHQQHTSTPLSHSDTSSSPSQLFFLSPQTPNTNQQSLNSTSQQSDGSFQMPLGVLNNAQKGALGPTKPTQKRRNRQGGPTVKTAEVWRFFKQKSPPEQAAVCDICNKTIKATNSSTTGMIRHLRSCHREQHEILEEARKQANLFKTLSSCVDDKSRELVLEAISKGSYLTKPPNHSTAATTRLDSSTNSSVSPNSTASSSAVDASIRTQLLLQNSSGIHSIDSLLDSSVEAKASNSMSNDSAPPPSTVFTSPTKYMVKIKSDLSRVEHEAKNAMEAQNLNVEDDDEDEDVENLAVTEEDSEEDASLVSNPKRQRLIEDSNKNLHRHFQRQKPVKQNAQTESIEKNIALMLLLDELPTEIVDQPGFRHLIANLVPAYRLPSAADFKSKILPQLRNQLPNGGDVTLLRQRFLENNRFSPGHSTTQAHTVHWPISPSNTCESGFDETVDASSETASSAASMNHIVEQSVRSAQNISQSFGFSTFFNPHNQQKKKLKNDSSEKAQKEEEMIQLNAEGTPNTKQELTTSKFLAPKQE